MHVLNGTINIYKAIIAFSSWDKMFIIYYLCFFNEEDKK